MADGFRTNSVRLNRITTHYWVAPAADGEGLNPLLVDYLDYLPPEGRLVMLYPSEEAGLAGPLEAFLVFDTLLPMGVTVEDIKELDLVVQECHKVD